MNDLISREAVNDVIIWHETDGSIAARKALDRIAELPTIPAIPLSVIEDIKAEIEHNVLDTLSDGGDDWFTAEKVNECLDIIDHHIKEFTAESEGKE